MPMMEQVDVTSADARPLTLAVSRDTVSSGDTLPVPDGWLSAGETTGVDADPSLDDDAAAGDDASDDDVAGDAAEPSDDDVAGDAAEASAAVSDELEPPESSADSPTAHAATGDRDNAKENARNIDHAFRRMPAPFVLEYADEEPMLIGTSLSRASRYDEQVFRLRFIWNGAALQSHGHPSISVYGYWYSAGFSPAFPSGRLIRPGTAPGALIVANLITSIQCSTL